MTAMLAGVPDAIRERIVAQVPVGRIAAPDEIAGGHVFLALTLGFALWSLVLLAIGIRVVNRWSWGRTAAAVGLFGLLVALADLALSVLGG